MATVLNRYFASKSLEKVVRHLVPGMQNLTRSLVAILGDDGYARVDAIHAALFPASTRASANSSLNRLLATLNAAAENHGIPVSVKITADKKVGAARRQIWCEGEAAGPATPYLSELKAIPTGALATEQRAAELYAPVVLLTFNEHETKAVQHVFGSGTNPPPDASGRYPVSNLGICGGVPIFHVVSQQGRLNAQDAVLEMIEDYRPNAVIAVGIAFGIDSGKQKIGDVLVSEYVRDYELGRLNRDGTFTPRGGKPPATDWLLNRIRHLDHTLSDTPLWPRLHIGTLMSGDKLIDHRPSRDALLAIEPEAIGGEMEASGVEAAARRRSSGWIIVKGISDWADGGKKSETKDRDQRVAALNAAKVAKAVLELGPFRPDGPRRDMPRPSQPAPSPNLPDLSKIPGEHFRRDARGRLISLHKDDLSTRREPARDVYPLGEEVLHYLHRWIEDPKEPPLLALLGEYGMGKTITCQQLWRELDHARRQDARQPIALYFDLRHVTIGKDGVPTLPGALTECMERGWLDKGDGRGFTVENIHEWIAQGAVVIIDGLDEVLVKVDAAAGQIFTNNLLKLMADAAAHATAAGRSLSLKMLISCRTHYFPTLRAQQTHFTSQERGETDAGRYRALLLLPWTDQQVRGYLTAVLPGMDVGRVEEMIGSVHDLKEVVPRPFTLKLVADFIPELERRRAAGLLVSGITLYRAMAERWLDRDQGKHLILPAHKLRLAAHLAAFLWRSRSPALTAERLQDWFHEWRDSQPGFSRYAALSPDQLEEDLRTATFLVRQDDESGSAFRFAHTSLSEFFLAEYLLQAIREDRPEGWSLPIPSAETLDFLGQMLVEAADAGLLQRLQAWRRLYRRRTSELLLAYALHARERNWPVPIVHGIRLEGATLRGWTLAGGTKGLDIGPACLAGSDLRDATLIGVRLDGADFGGARMDHATLVDCRFVKVRFENASLTATVFRRCCIENCRWSGATGRRTQFLLCQPEGVRVVAGATLQQPLFAPAPAPPKNVALAWLTGHKRGVNACAWSPDGARLASSGGDGTVRLWDAATGEAVAVLRGHGGAVHACAWSPDGAHLASGGDDGTVRVWDAATGEAVAVLQGHGDWVRACAWSPDGARLASGGDDGTARVWDAATGEAVAVLQGHGGIVHACAWSLDGARLASSGDDGTVRVWDAATDEAVAVLQGHGGRVNACAWSPDGAHLASGGYDRTVRVWDAATGEAVAVLQGHDGRVHACAWSPDGARLASGGDDGTVRVWDAATGEAVAVLQGHDGRVNACAWSPDGTRLASGGEDGTVRVWDAVAGDLARIHGQWTGDDGAAGYAVWLPAENRVVCASDDAWKFLVWQGRDEQGWPTRYPLEVFGRCPVSKKVSLYGNGQRLFR
jgi:WD40 repeat protein/nucleoside phosphorylase